MRGTKRVYSRVELGAVQPPGDGTLRIYFLRPDGSPSSVVSTTIRTSHGRGYWWFEHAVTFDRVGRWRIVVELGPQRLAQAPVDVVANARAVRNRPPRRIAATLVPPTPEATDVVQCNVTTELAKEDPDFDIVRYRYRWTVDGKLVRAVQSAALSDVLRKGLAGAGKTVRCSVTPSDGRLSGPTATAPTP